MIHPPIRYVLTLGCLLVLSLVALPAAALQNQLKNHPSPYLALHASDPVAWQDWGETAVQAARRDKKLLFISIGYFSCHWCHVMQQESYKNRDIAAYLNKNFIPVKVDRELEPTLDARLIEFAENTRGQSGWPLNVFVTPDGYPLYAALYLPPGDFMSILTRLQGMWRDDPKELARLARSESPKADGPGQPRLDPAQVVKLRRATVAAALQGADTLQGGFGNQSKFPSAPQLEFLLDELARKDDPKLREFLVLTFDHMADYGLYDHVGDGFFRYTVDPDWRTPHFEKMLYDNAQLAQLFRRGAKILKQPRYAEVARRTLDFMQKELCNTGVACVAALSALDDKGVEGGYYLWTEDQLRKVLGPEEQKVYRQAFGMTDAPPFEAGWLPVRLRNAQQVAATLKMKPQQVETLLQSARNKLLAARAQRRLPVDGKQLAAWNGLALAAFAEAAASEPGYRKSAESIRNYLVNVLWSGRELHRAVTGKSRRPVGRASAEDYAYVAEGLYAWARLTGLAGDREIARRVLDEGWKRFYGKQGWRMGEDSLIEAESGRDVLYDGPMPSPSGVMAGVALRMAADMKDDRLRDRTLAALNSGYKSLSENPFWYASQVRAMAGAGR